MDVTITLRAAGTPSVRDPFTGQRRPPISTRRDPATNRTTVRVPLRDQAVRPRLRRRPRRRGHGAQRRHRPHRAVGGRDRRAAPAGARRRRSRARAPRRAGAHGAALPSDHDRSRLRRGHREPLLRRSRRRRVGGAVVLRQRHQVGARSAGVPAAAGREGAVAAARPAAGRRLPLPSRRHRDHRRRRLLRRPLHAERGVDGEVAVSRHRVDRSRDVPPPQAAGGPDRVGRARSSRTTRRCASRASARRAAARSSCRSRPSPARSCSSPAATSWSRRPPASASTSSIRRTSRRGASRRGAAIA